MERFRWIREGDRAACDGMVIEGDQSCTSHGRAYAFEGARLICQKKCVIAEGTTRRTLTHGRKAVLHGMKTSSGCSLLSSLDDHVDASDRTDGSARPGHLAHDAGHASTVVWLPPRVDYGPAGAALNEATGAPPGLDPVPRRRMRQKRRLSSMLLLAIGTICGVALYRYILA